MNWLDIALLVILAISTLMSFRKGFSREIIGLAASLFALVLGMWFYGLAGSFVAPYVSSPRVANLLGFFILVVGVLVTGSIAGAIVSRFIRTIGLSFFDRLLGAAFGLLRGLLVAIAVLTAFTAFGAQAAPQALLHSRIAPYVLEASRFFVAVAPMDLKQSFRRRYSGFKRGKEDLQP
ncbi:MAG: CvpA family protein [Acidobacteriota bacterium]|nr:CvpA family protein [Acidobacteriota bacterium]